MAERQRTEIDAGLLARVRAVAEVQGRPEFDVLEEAVVGYLSFLYARSEFVGRPERDSAGIGRSLEEIYAEGSEGGSAWGSRSLAELFALVNRWQREKGTESLSDEEAMRLAVQEQRAVRSERETPR